MSKLRDLRRAVRGVCALLLSAGLLLQAAGPAASAPEPSSATPSLDSILASWQQADHQRQTRFPGYTSLREYQVENSRFGVHAGMKVQVSVDAAGRKQFKILESKGPGPIRKMVFQRMLDTETGASSPEKQAATRISPDNYRFQFDSLDSTSGRKRYVLIADPKSNNPLLFRGKVWVDAEDFAVVRIDGAPAQNPSFWVQKTHFVHEYTNVGGYWLAASNRSDTDVRIFGHTVVQITYSSYALNSTPVAAGESSGGRD